MRSIRAFYQTVTILMNNGVERCRKVFDRWAGLGLPILLAMIISSILNQKEPFIEKMPKVSKEVAISIITGSSDEHVNQTNSSKIDPEAPVDHTAENDKSLGD